MTYDDTLLDQISKLQLYKALKTIYKHKILFDISCFSKLVISDHLQAMELGRYKKK